MEYLLGIMALVFSAIATYYNWKTIFSQERILKEDLKLNYLAKAHECTCFSMCNDDWLNRVKSTRAVLYALGESEVADCMSELVACGIDPRNGDRARVAAALERLIEKRMKEVVR